VLKAYQTRVFWAVYLTDVTGYIKKINGRMWLKLYDLVNFEDLMQLYVLTTIIGLYTMCSEKEEFWIDSTKIFSLHDLIHGMG